MHFLDWFGLDVREKRGFYAFLRPCVLYKGKTTTKKAMLQGTIAKDVLVFVYADRIFYNQL